MPLETPKFWRSKGLIAQLLRPASCLYYWGHKFNTSSAKTYKSSIPVICIGGVVAGGSGKTPVLHGLLKMIRAHGPYENPVILCRGYGGALKGPSVVDPKVHTAKDVGDEALLHARYAPTIISPDRAAGAKLAEGMGADAILMDDGLQNNSLYKTFSFLVINARYGIGNGYMLPAGPLREPLVDALSRCNAIISTGGILADEYPQAILATEMTVTSTHDKKKTYLGFAGIAHPEKFKHTLEEHGFLLEGFKSFPDHHPYSDADMKNLLKKAGAHKLITTEKDFVRIPDVYKDKVECLVIEIFFKNPDHLQSIFRSA